MSAKLIHLSSTKTETPLPGLAGDIFCANFGGIKTETMRRFFSLFLMLFGLFLLNACDKAAENESDAKRDKAHLSAVSAGQGRKDLSE